MRALLASLQIPVLALASVVRTDQQTLQADGFVVCNHTMTVPSLYIIGAENSGTSTLAAWISRRLLHQDQSIFRDACELKELAAMFHLNGVVSAECHLYDDQCGWDGKMIHGMGTYGGTFATQAPTVGHCPSMDASSIASERAALQDPSKFGLLPCSYLSDGAHKLYFDKSPTYFRLIGLPTYLSSLYGSRAAARLSFIALLRNPISRMHSAWQQAAADSKGSFSTVPALSTAQGYSEMLLATLPANYNMMFVRGEDSPIVRNYTYDFFYRSLYGALLKPWVEKFASQMLVLPMNYTFTEGSQEQVLTQVLSLVERNSGVSNLEISSRSASIPPHNVHNAASNPKYVGYDHPLDQDINSATRQALRSRFFDADAELLGVLLSNAISHGLMVAGDANGMCATAQGCSEYIISAW